MPCKIAIEQNIISVVEDKTNHALDKTYDEAIDIANGVNAEFGATVVGFTQTPSGVNREIGIPSELIDLYYDHETMLEQREVTYEQDDSMPSSKASKALLEKTKASIKKMGINLEELDAYLKGNPAVKTGGINGLADLAKGTIAVALGKEDTALLEEYVHIASAMLEQTDPKLITALISKIE